MCYHFSFISALHLQKETSVGVERGGIWHTRHIRGRKYLLPVEKGAHPRLQKRLEQSSAPPHSCLPSSVGCTDARTFSKHSDTLQLWSVLLGKMDWSKPSFCLDLSWFWFCFQRKQCLFIHTAHLHLLTCFHSTPISIYTPSRHFLTYQLVSTTSKISWNSRW